MAIYFDKLLKVSNKYELAINYKDFYFRMILYKILKIN